MHVVEQLQTQKRQDDVPAILYVEPGPNVSTLDSGAYFTVFICGTLFLVQVLRVLRKPNKAVAIDLPSQSSAGPAIPESESLRESSCTGSGSLPSPAGSPQLRFCTPDATFQVQRPNRDLDPSPSSVEEDDCILVGPPLSMQAPIPNRVVDSELLSSDYGWTRTTSPLPLTLQDENGSPSRVLCDTAPRAQLDSVRDSFVCPLRTPDTPGQPKTESLAAQYGSLLARGRSEISEQEIDEAHKLTQLWPTPFLPAVGASELRKNVTPTAGSPTSSLEAGLSSKMRLSRILGPAFSQGPEGSRKYTSFKPDLDPKVSVVNGNGGGSCHSPLPAPIGTGRPLGTPSPLPVGQPFLNSSSGLLPNSFGGQPFSPFPRRVDSTRRECSAVSRRADLPTVGTVLNPFIGKMAFIRLVCAIHLHASS